jgi:hypothetical protein
MKETRERPNYQDEELSDIDDPENQKLSETKQLVLKFRKIKDKKRKEIIERSLNKEKEEMRLHAKTAGKKSKLDGLSQFDR